MSRCQATSLDYLGTPYWSKLPASSIRAAQEVATPQGQLHSLFGDLCSGVSQHQLDIDMDHSTVVSRERRPPRMRLIPTPTGRISIDIA